MNLKKVGYYPMVWLCPEGKVNLGEMLKSFNVKSEDIDKVVILPRTEGIDSRVIIHGYDIFLEVEDE